MSATPVINTDQNQRIKNAPMTQAIAESRNSNAGVRPAISPALKARRKPMNPPSRKIQRMFVSVYREGAFEKRPDYIGLAFAG